MLIPWSFLHLPFLGIFPLPEWNKQLREPTVIFGVNHFPKYQSSCTSASPRSQHFYRIAGGLVKGFHKICMNSLYTHSKRRTDISQQIIFLCRLWWENIDQLIPNCFLGLEQHKKHWVTDVDHRKSYCLMSFLHLDLQHTMPPWMKLNLSSLILYQQEKTRKAVPAQSFKPQSH